MTNALVFFNHNDFFGISKHGVANDIIWIIKNNAKTIYEHLYQKKKLPADAKEPGNPELPWENNSDFWKELNDTKILMAEGIKTNHYILPEVTEKFYLALLNIINELNKKYFKQTPAWLSSELLTSRYASDLCNLFYWLRGARRLGINAYLMSKEEFIEDCEQNPNLIDELIEKIDIHVAFDMKTKYDDELVSRIVQEGKIIVGQDGGFDKAQFALIPYMLNSWQTHCKDLPEEYLEAIKCFVDKYDGKMAELIPPFASVPTKTQYTESLVTELMEFFRKIGCTKIIIKGNNTANNKGSAMYEIASRKKVYCPYMFLDVRSEPENWVIELENYRMRYGMTGCMILQAVVRDFEGARQIEQKFEEAIVHKTTVIGDVVWRRCVKTVYYHILSFWNKTDPRILSYGRTDLHYASETPEYEIGKKSKSGFIGRIGTILQSVSGVLSHAKARTHASSNLEEEFIDIPHKLDLAGEYINLISPLGAHALDIVFGQIEEQGERQMYLLEANPSNTRSDTFPINQYAGRFNKGQKTVFDEYLEWALKVCNGDKTAAGEYTKKLFFELDKNEREKYLQGVHQLWEKADFYLAKYLIYCNDGALMLKKPAILKPVLV